MSLVVLSPTNEGNVCDIQLVIIAMVLSTTPIFNKGTDISAVCTYPNPSFYGFQRETSEAIHVARRSLVYHPCL